LKWVFILVEGQTEETFVREVLYHHFILKEICLVPTLATTKRIRSGGHYKGGIVGYGKVKGDLQRLLKDTNTSAVTTFIDFYGLGGKDFPGWDTQPKGTCFQQVDHVQRAFADDINDPRFIPYLALHEFEAMLFVDPDKIAHAFPEESSRLGSKLSAIKADFSSPEEINHKHPPSKRIQNLVTSYDKETTGVIIAMEIGLDRIRLECQHFDQWSVKLEALSEAT